MASNGTGGATTPQARAKTALAGLRKAAGYRSGREFAEAIGIPATTYLRYERVAGSPEAGIPLRAAWAIADALHCTIDAVVGRERGGGEGGRDLNAAYRALSDGGRERLDEYLQFLDFRDRLIATQGW